jgi:hypothetical protein
LSPIPVRAALAALVVLGAVGPTRAAEPPLFAAFKSLCVDTGAVPEAVGAAVKAAGGKASRPPTSTDRPIRMTAFFWNVSIGGHDLMVSAIKAHDPSPQGGNSVECAIQSYQNEDGGLAKIRGWVGVPADRDGADGSSIQYFSFQQVGDKRTALSGDSNTDRRLQARGVLWQLMVASDPRSANVQLMHFLPARGRHG